MNCENPYCESSSICEDTTNGTMVCTSCGTIAKDFIFQEHTDLGEQTIDSTFENLIEQLCGNLQIHKSILNCATQAFKKEKFNFQNRHMETIAYAFIYCAAIQNNYTIDSRIFRLSEKTLRQAVKLVIDRFSMNEQVSRYVYLKMKVKQFARHLSLKKKDILHIIKLIPKVDHIMRKNDSIAIALIVRFTKSKLHKKILCEDFNCNSMQVTSILEELLI